MFDKLVRSSRSARRQLVVNEETELLHDNTSKVSDLDSSMISEDEAEIDTLIDPKNATGLITSNATGDNDTDSILNREYGDEAPPPSLPSVSEQLAKTVTKWLRVTPPREFVWDLFKKMLQPDNIEGLKPVKINEVLYQSIPFSAKINDQHFRGINTFFTRAVDLLVHVLDKLISLEASTQKDGSCVKTEQGKIQIGDCLFDVHDMRTKVNDVCRLLCAGNSTVLQKHKGLLKSWVLPKYQYLTKPNNPVSDDLLGPNIEQRICDSAKLSEAKLVMVLEEDITGHNLDLAKGSSPGQHSIMQEIDLSSKGFVKMSTKMK